MATKTKTAKSTTKTIAARKATATRRANATKGAVKDKAKTAAKREYNRLDIEETSKIKVVGEHNRKEGSRWYKSYELMRKAGNYGNFIKKGGLRAALHDAVNEGYAKIA